MPRVIKLKDQKQPPVQADWQAELTRTTCGRRVPDNGGYDRGYQEGYARGRDEGMRLAHELMSQVEEGRRLAEESRHLAEESRRLAEAAQVRVVAGQREMESLRHELRDSVVSLTLAATRRILRRELSLQPEHVISLVYALLAEAREQEDIKVLVNPGDAVTIEGQKAELLKGLRATQRVQIIPDPGIEPGGALLETPGGSWDARIESQLGAVEAALREVATGDGEQPRD